MPYGLEIGNERTVAITKEIQDELMRRSWALDEEDTVMAEYCVIMIINNKTHAQILNELNDLIGTSFEDDFVDWLFQTVQKAAPEAAPAPPPEPKPAPATPSREAPPHTQNDNSRRPPQAPRAPLYQQAISQALPSSSPNEKKRTRSQSPAQSSKIRRTDLPTGPRAMYRDGHDQPGGSRSLLDRMGPRNGQPHGNFPNHQSRNDHIQQRIDSITNGHQPPPDMPVMMNPAFPMNGMPPMDMNAMAAGMTNPLVLQEMMMNQMALMSQMAGALGMMNQGVPMMNNGGFPMQPGMDAPGFNPNGQHMDNGRGRGRGRGGPPGRGRGRGGPPMNDRHISNPVDVSGPSLDAPTASTSAPALSAAVPTPAPAPVVAPTPSVAAPAPAAVSGGRTGFVPPERPQSPTLCKFGLKCTNALCRWSHPSPVATPESGVVLSNDPCEKGKDCKDKDCIKAHVSPAVLNPAAEHPKPNHYTPPPTHHSGPHQVPCRFGLGCTRPSCPFQHPPRQGGTQPCRFGAACTRTTCPFQHPEGRVLPNSFHRGLATTGGLSTVASPETGSMGQPSPHKSVKFNKTASTAAELEKKMKEMEEMKNKVAKAEAAAANKKQEGSNGSKSVSISA